MQTLLLLAAVALWALLYGAGLLLWWQISRSDRPTRREPAPNTARGGPLAGPVYESTASTGPTLARHRRRMAVRG